VHDDPVHERDDAGRRHQLAALRGGAPLAALALHERDGGRGSTSSQLHADAGGLRRPHRGQGLRLGVV
ncbi:unnamed protein product, partial [Lampetra planeri]